LLTHAQQTFETLLKQKLAAIKEKLNRLIQRNAMLPDMERIDKSEFIVNYEKRDSMIQESDLKVNEIRQEIALQNLKKRVIRNRIKVMVAHD
jgi:hypothetical protein